MVCSVIDNFQPRLALIATALVSAAVPAKAGVGDLLVAPTRIVLDGRRGTEVILNNIGHWAMYEAPEAINELLLTRLG